MTAIPADPHIIASSTPRVAAYESNGSLCESGTAARQNGHSAQIRNNLHFGRLDATILPTNAQIGNNFRPRLHDNGFAFLRIANRHDAECVK